jgi:hypothetical protein
VGNRLVVRCGAFAIATSAFSLSPIVAPSAAWANGAWFPPIAYIAEDMGAFVVTTVVAAILAVGAAYGLYRLAESSRQLEAAQASTESAQTDGRP